MAQQDFSFGNALSHWTKTEGPGGYIWKHAVAFGLLTVIMIAAWFYFAGGAFFEYINAAERMSTGGNPQDVMDAGMGLLLPSLLLIPFGLLFWAMFEGAQQRRYMRGDGFSLKIGADEGRLIVVGLLWILTMVGLYIAIAVVVGGVLGVVFAASGDGGGAAALALIPVILLVYGVLIFFIVRLSPAGALTVRDRAIRFTSAWNVTRGRFWPMFFAFLVMFVIVLVVSLLLQLVLGVAMFGAMAANPDLASGNADPDQVMSILFSPATFVIMAGIYFVMTAIQAVIQFAFAGIPALAAKTDPNWSGDGSAVSAFD